MPPRSPDHPADPKRYSYNRYLRRWVKLKALPHYSVAEILRWADAFHRRHGKWPNAKSGPVRGSLYETWAKVNRALTRGLRGLEGGSSLALLLVEHRGVRSQAALPPLSVEQILEWADAYRKRTGSWPTRKCGVIPRSGGETWHGLSKSLRRGSRGLPRFRSLSHVLELYRGKRVPPRLTIPQILRWADQHRERTGDWPQVTSGPIADAPNESWRMMEHALRAGHRGLEGGSSLARLLAEHRGKRNQKALPPVRVSQILRWADAHRRRTGRWPNTATRGPIPGAPISTWAAVDAALRQGIRGLPGGTRLARLLAQRRGVPNRWPRPPLSVAKILRWADAYHRRTGRWPGVLTPGPVPGAADDTWPRLDKALRKGGRGLPGGSSLARLLAERRGVRNLRALPPLSVARILRWARAHRRATGHWPTQKTLGPIPEAPGESWQIIHVALREGKRGLPAGMSLAELAARRR
jgi:hypothetical protein